MLTRRFLFKIEHIVLDFCVNFFQFLSLIEIYDYNFNFNPKLFVQNVN